MRRVGPTALFACLMHRSTSSRCGQSENKQPLCPLLRSVATPVTKIVTGVGDGEFQS